MAKAITITCKNPGETFNLGVSLGEILVGGDVVILQGELGAGKTWFTKGIAHGLGITNTNTVTSPSFTIINEYQGRLPLFHMDFYRLENEEASSDLGLEEYLYGQGVTVIEWPERLA
ncbi:MAG: tRNA (adenosine(37)-N6)-threonylcarbamoyltransferase complex ATPase subunit type 1 TsaE, partial [Deltaproteobacteria bacterium]|nr:tRNA (adenosine(37)-N6)-threonylcarbamoyltransferase complex ATPase subunit type 1 TsaE [Deltaproteobacteria bacterium]